MLIVYLRDGDDAEVCVMNHARLRSLRQARAMSQRDLAAKSGVAQDTISDLEKGTRRAQPRTVRKLARALRTSPEALIVDGERASDTASPSEWGIGELTGNSGAMRALPEGFVVIGRLGSEWIAMGWRSGKLFGEDHHVEYALFEAELGDRKLGGPHETSFVFDAERSLKDPWEAYTFLTHDVFDEVEQVAGTVPERPVFPKGTIH